MQLTKEQQSVITGSLLGDGHITRQRSLRANCHFTKKQAARRKEYIKWHCEVLQSIGTRFRSFESKQPKAKMCEFHTRVHPELTKLRHQWYPDGVKIIPKNLSLDPLSIAVWFFDDGSNYLKKEQIGFATYCFTRDECWYLADLMKDQFSIKCSVPKSCKIVYIHRQSYSNFLDLIEPFNQFQCFKYKCERGNCKPSFRFLSDAEYQKIIELYDVGMSLSDIANQLKRSVSVVSTVLRRERPNDGLSLDNTSGHKGISWDKSRKKWVAQPYTGKCKPRKNIGRFDRKEDAIAAIEKFYLQAS